MDDDDLMFVYEAIKYFNEMDESADINHALSLLEDAQEILGEYFSQIDPS